MMKNSVPNKIKASSNVIRYDFGFYNCVVVVIHRQFHIHDQKVFQMNGHISHPVTGFAQMIDN